MDNAIPTDDEERVLVFAPYGRDAELTCDVLARDGIVCEPCTDVADILQKAASGAAAILIADDVIAPGDLERVGTALARQESWSDLPIIVATTAVGSRGAHQRIRPHLERAGSVTILERPIPTVTLLTAVRSALNARRRQYQLRDLLAELRTKTHRLQIETMVRERFVAILAHDLRGPLSTLSMAVNLLARGGVPPSQRQVLARRTARNLAQMDRMIHDLLDVHRIHAGRRLPLRLHRCDLAALSRQVAEELSTIHGDRFVVVGEERVEGIWGGEVLARALWNLGTNAVKYGDFDAPIEFVVGRNEDGAWVRVHNEGPAIPPEDQATLFDPFTRTRMSDAGEKRGWGLGLSLVRGCAESHGGSVEVQSTPDEGTTFTIRLPWDARPFQTPEDSRASNESTRPQLH